jgi:hypothetical protein
MNSDIRNECSHPLGFPIRKSPDHSLLAASRGLSQLITSFIAFLRQGIHTHALSSLTIKSTSHTTRRYFRAYILVSRHPAFRRLCRYLYARQKIFSFQRSIALKNSGVNRHPSCPLTYELSKMVGLGGLEPPTSSLSGMRSSHLSYRPRRYSHLVELVGIEPATS